MIHNLSQYGLLIETAAPLRVSEVIRVELPEAGTIDAKVIWSSESSAGCRFLTPLPKSAISAALLRSPAPKGAHVSVWQPELPLVSVVGSEEARSFEGIEAEYQERDRSIVLTFIALLVSLVVTALFILALLRMAVPE